MAKCDEVLVGCINTHVVVYIVCHQFDEIYPNFIAFACASLFWSWVVLSWRWMGAWKSYPLLTVCGACGVWFASFTSFTPLTWETKLLFRLCWRKISIHIYFQDDYHYSITLIYAQVSFKYLVFQLCIFFTEEVHLLIQFYVFLMNKISLQ